MKTKDPRVDAYIAKSADFAKPILKHIRKLVHQACPEVQETIKWNFPHFDYEGGLCFMAGFKQHCAFGFWKASLLDELAGMIETQGPEAMGQFGKITSLADLPSDRKMLSLIKKAAKLNDDGVKPSPSTKKAATQKVKVPEYFLKTLKRDKQAFAMFEKFSPSHQREYVEWITEAKSEETRERRMVQALEWIAEGKSRNWKYMKRK